MDTYVCPIGEGSIPLSLLSRYLVMELMSSDLYKTLKSQKLTNDQVRFQMYQVLRGLKVYTPNTNTPITELLATFSALLVCSLSRDHSQGKFVFQFLIFLLFNSDSSGLHLVLITMGNSRKEKKTNFNSFS